MPQCCYRLGQRGESKLLPRTFEYPRNTRESSKDLEEADVGAEGYTITSLADDIERGISRCLYLESDKVLPLFPGL